MEYIVGAILLSPLGLLVWTYYYTDVPHERVKYK